MRVFERRGFVVAVFDSSDDLEELHDIQDNAGLATGQKNKIIYVALDGTDDIYLYPECFLVKNYNASLYNHFLWEGHLTEEEQEDYLMTMLDNFIETGKQVLIEEYEFVEDEPFYDYSGGRE